MQYLFEGFETQATCEFLWKLSWHIKHLNAWPQHSNIGTVYILSSCWWIIDRFSKFFIYTILSFCVPFDEIVLYFYFFLSKFV